jgi:hypothetical protein
MEASQKQTDFEMDFDDVLVPPVGTLPVLPDDLSQSAVLGVSLSIEELPS